MSAAEPIRSRKELKSLAGYFLGRGRIRDCSMVVLGVYTGLRISDLLGLRWEDVYDSGTGRFRAHLEVTEKKGRTGPNLPVGRIALKKQNESGLQGRREFLRLRRGIPERNPEKAT